MNRTGAGRGLRLTGLLGRGGMNHRTAPYEDDAVSNTETMIKVCLNLGRIAALSREEEGQGRFCYFRRRSQGGGKTARPMIFRLSCDAAWSMLLRGKHTELNEKRLLWSAFPAELCRIRAKRSKSRRSVK